MSNSEILNGIRVLMYIPVAILEYLVIGIMIYVIVVAFVEWVTKGRLRIMAGQLLYIRSDMSKGNVEFKKDNEFYTPKEIVNRFGKFDYDPATVKEKAEEFGIEHYDTIETDGLKADWTQYKRIWCNPPLRLNTCFCKSR